MVLLVYPLILSVFLHSTNANFLFNEVSKRFLWQSCKEFKISVLPYLLKQNIILNDSLFRFFFFIWIQRTKQEHRNICWSYENWKSINGKQLIFVFSIFQQSNMSYPSNKCMCNRSNVLRKIDDTSYLKCSCHFYCWILKMREKRENTKQKNNKVKIPTYVRLTL